MNTGQPQYQINYKYLEQRRIDARDTWEADQDYWDVEFPNVAPALPPEPQETSVADAGVAKPQETSVALVKTNGKRVGCSDWIIQYMNQRKIEYRVSKELFYTGDTGLSEDDLVREMYVASEKLNFSRNRIAATVEQWKHEADEQAKRDLIDQMKYWESITPDDSEIDRFIESCLGRVGNINKSILKHFIWQVKTKLFGKKVEHHMMPILIGKTGGGKTEATRRLLEPLSSFVYPSATLETLTDKREQLIFKRNLVVVLDDVSKASKADIESIKNIISSDILKPRLFYTQKTTSINNMSTFIGSSNSTVQDLIKDEHSARRFWEFRCVDKLDWDTINNIDYRKIYGAVSVDDPPPVAAFINEIYDLQDRQLRYKNIYEQFVEDRVVPCKTMFISNDGMFNAFKSWCIEQDIKFGVAKRTVGTQLKKLLPEWCYENVKHYVGGKQERGYLCNVEIPTTDTTAHSVEIVVDDRPEEPEKVEEEKHNFADIDEDDLEVW